MEGVGTPSLAIIGAGRAGSALAIAAHDAGYRIAAVASRRGEMAARLADTVGAEAVATPLAAVTVADVTLLAVPDGAISSVASDIAVSGVALRRTWRCAPGCAVRARGHRLVARHRGRGWRAAPADGAGRTRQRVTPRGRVLPHRRDRTAARAPARAGGRAARNSRSTSTPPMRRCTTRPRSSPATRRLRCSPRRRGFSRARVSPPRRRTPRSAALLEGAAHNARRGGPAAALTGPVARGDTDAIAAHLDALAHHPEARDLYLHLTRAMESLVADVPASAPPREGEAGSQVA